MTDPTLITGFLIAIAVIAFIGAVSLTSISDAEDRRIERERRARWGGEP